MPNEKHIFAATQWSLKAAIIVTTLLVAAIACGFIWVVVAWNTGFVAELLARKAGEIGEMSLNIGSLHATFNPFTEITADDLAEIALTGLAGAATIITLTLLIFRAVLRVVVSASVGDPFVEQNATEITRVAWLWLSVQAAQMITKLAVYEAIPAALRAKLNHIDHAFEIPVTGLFAALLIFVLAQIFRRGTEMRAELEATI